MEPTPRIILSCCCSAFALLACTPPPRTLSPPTETTRAYDLESARAAPEFSAPLADSGRARAVVSACRLSVTESVGCRTSDIEAVIAPVRSRIESCRGTTGGKLRIRVHEAAGKLAFDVEPGMSLDPTEKQCVLDALATIHEGVSSTVWTGASVPPTGFTSLITIEW